MSLSNFDWQVSKLVGLGAGDRMGSTRSRALWVYHAEIVATALLLPSKSGLIACVASTTAAPRRVAEVILDDVMVCSLRRLLPFVCRPGAT